MNTTKLDTTTRLTTNATVGDLVDAIQRAMNDDTLGTVSIDTAGRLRAEPADRAPTYMPHTTVIDIPTWQAAINKPVTATQLAKLAIINGLVDEAIDKAADRQTYRLYLPDPHEARKRDVATEYVAVAYNTMLGVTGVTIDSDFTGRKVLAVLAAPGEWVTQDELEERLSEAQPSIAQQLKDIIRG